MKELEAEWAREAQGASDSDDDVVLVEPKRRPGAAGGASLVTCETAQRAPTSPSHRHLSLAPQGGGGGGGLK